MSETESHPTSPTRPQQASLTRTLRSRVRQRLQRVPILYRIAIGNGLIIIVGAVGGTLVTRYLAREAADLSLIFAFSGLGILLTVIINTWMIRTALRPFYELRRLMDGVPAGQAEIDSQLLRNADPDINQLAAALHTLIQELEERSVTLRALSERAINVQEDERKRIARGLHDDTSQALSMLIINLERVEQSIPEEDSELQAKLASARELTTQTLKDLRQVILGLRPTILDDLGLVAAIRWFARSSLESNGIQVEFEVSEEPLPLTPQQETTLFRIAQEAINNIVRHAEAKAATITLRGKQGQVCLWISDRGRGFDVVKTSDKAVELHRLGLLGIRERAALIGGKVTVDSTLGQGTRIRVCVPLADTGVTRHGRDPDSSGR